MAHILVVEDEEHLAKGIRFNLQAEGYDVSVSGDGASALQLINASQTPVDLVVLDLMLPGMSGYSVCEQLRDQGSEIPILMLSARTLPEDRTRGFDVGADQYLTKPFELDELLSRIKGLLTRHGGRAKSAPPKAKPSELPSINGRLVNFETFEVTTIDQTCIHLTAMEIKLLRYFWENEGRVIPRYELLEEVWEQPGRIQTRAPDQFMRRLRKLFEDDSAKPKHFVTVRDAGYRFIRSPD
ncbi:MAG: response regulator transcription factor [Planctomycetales bacterium]|nr:response regulator transcription factor [Planctomycetales bacterium]